MLLLGRRRRKAPHERSSHWTRRLDVLWNSHIWKALMKNKVRSAEERAGRGLSIEIWYGPNGFKKTRVRPHCYHLWTCLLLVQIVAIWWNSRSEHSGHNDNSLWQQHHPWTFWWLNRITWYWLMVPYRISCEEGIRQCDHRKLICFRGQW